MNAEYLGQQLVESALPIMYMDNGRYGRKDRLLAVRCAEALFTAEHPALAHCKMAHRILADVLYDPIAKQMLTEECSPKELKALGEAHGCPPHAIHQQLLHIAAEKKKSRFSKFKDKAKARWGKFKTWYKKKKKKKKKKKGGDDDEDDDEYGRKMLHDWDRRRIARKRLCTMASMYPSSSSSGSKPAVVVEGSYQDDYYNGEPIEYISPVCEEALLLLHEQVTGQGDYASLGEVINEEDPEETRLSVPFMMLTQRGRLVLDRLEWTPQKKVTRETANLLNI